MLVVARGVIVTALVAGAPVLGHDGAVALDVEETGEATWFHAGNGRSTIA